MSVSRVNEITQFLRWMSTALQAAAGGGGAEVPPQPQRRMHFSAEASHAVLAYAAPEFVLYAVSSTRTGSSRWPHCLLLSSTQIKQWHEVLSLCDIVLETS